MDMKILIHAYVYTLSYRQSTPSLSFDYAGCRLTKSNRSTNLPCKNLDLTSHLSIYSKQIRNGPQSSSVRRCATPSCDVVHPICDTEKRWTEIEGKPRTSVSPSLPCIKGSSIAQLHSSALQIIRTFAGLRGSPASMSMT